MGVGGTEAQEGRDICEHRADSHCSTAKANTTLESSYTPIKKKLKTNTTPFYSDGL